jgi:opacity protein-like surface antigen
MLVLLATPVHAQLYAEASGSLSFALVEHGSRHDQLGPTTQQTAPAAGFGVRIGGYKPGSYWGAEVEAMHTNAPIKAGTLSTWAVTPAVTQMLPGRAFAMNSLGINGLVRYPGETVEPYLGLGLAYLVAELGPDVCANGWPACGPLSSGYADSTQTAATMGYVLKTGLHWKTTAHWGLTLTYELQQASFQFPGVIPGNCCGGAGETIAGAWQTVQLGLRYRFGD